MFLLLVWMLGCSGGEESPAEPTAVEAAPAAPAASAGPTVPNPASPRLAASHVLVAYVGASAAPSSVVRSKDEARARAEELRAKILAGEPLEAVARASSDDATGPRGGSLGSFDPGTMVGPFEEAVKALPVGGISAVVETPFGFHVIRRDPVIELRASHLFVSWAGAERAPTGVTRTKEEAHQRMLEARAALDAGEPWAAVVERYSDGPMKDDGGDLGWLSRKQLAAPLDTAVFDLAVGARTDVLESTRGYHIFQRTE